MLVRYILRRAFVHLADRSMAVLLERKFGQFQDSLLTTVELAEAPDHAVEFNPEMLVHTQQDALARIADLPLRQVFDLRPLVRRAPWRWCWWPACWPSAFGLPTRWAPGPAAI